MDYKKFIKSRQLRFKILKLLSFLPDSIMLSLQYYIKLRRFPNLKNPQRYSEKLQVYKMKYRNPIMHICVDKYDVREWVKGKGLESILCKQYGVFDNPDDIDFSIIPNRFVMKTTDGGGGQDVIICKDKSAFDCKLAIKEMTVSMKKNKIDFGREWAYTGIEKSRIIIEEFLEDEETKDEGLRDYKFFCFNGVCQYLYVIAGRNLKSETSFGIFNREFEDTGVYRDGEERLKNNILKPLNFEKMITIAEQLSSDFPHVRVDLYNVNNNIVFGELTFYGASGYVSYSDDSFDFEIGRNWKI